ncbi:MAG: helix-turn-helix domain-containing protein [Thermodesulfobacteriota bacterium]|nr:helix-turn-helix domain-containing protein [Thermodesulfobacteriota bacterium]
MKDQLANIILFHRKRSGLTQLELAEMAGVGKNMVYELESGKQSVRLDNLLRILRLLRVHSKITSYSEAQYKHLEKRFSII